MNKKLFLKKVYPLLTVLAQMNDDERKEILKFLDNEGCKALYECIDNIIYNHTIPEDIRQILHDKLYNQRKTFKFLADAEDNSKENQFKKKAKLISINSNIKYILEIILPLLEKYLKKKLNKNE